MPTDLISLEIERDAILLGLSVHFDYLEDWLRGHTPNAEINAKIDQIHRYQTIMRSEFMQAHRVVGITS